MQRKTPYVLRLVARLRRSASGSLPLPIRKAYWRINRAANRRGLYVVAAAAWFACATVMSSSAVPTLGPAQAIANEAWGEHLYSQWFASETAAAAILLHVGSLAFFALAGTEAMRLSGRPNLSTARRVNRYSSAAFCLLFCRFVIAPVAIGTQELVSRNELRQVAGYHAIWLAGNISAETAGRIARDDAANVWYATPLDGAVAKEIKTCLHRCAQKQKGELRERLSKAADPAYFHVSRPLE